MMRSISAARSSTEVEEKLSNARLAASTARSASAAPPSATCANASSRVGSTSWTGLGLIGSTHWPSMYRCGYCFMGRLLLGLWNGPVCQLRSAAVRVAAVAGDRLARDEGGRRRGQEEHDPDQVGGDHASRDALERHGALAARDGRVDRAVHL